MRLLRLLREVDAAGVVATSTADGDAAEAVAGWFADIETRAADLGVAEPGFGEKVQRYVGDPRGGAWDEIAAAVRTVVAQLDSQLAETAPSVEKGRGWLYAVACDEHHGGTSYEAVVASRPNVPDAVVEQTSRDWKQEWDDFRRRRGTGWGGPRNIWWTSRDHEEWFDDLGRYRLYEAFNLSQFEQVFEEVAEQAGEGLLAAACELRPYAADPTPWPQAREAAFRAWQVSRCPTLSLKLASTLDLVLKGLVNARRPDSSLPSPIRTDPPGAPSDYFPDASATAAAAIAVFKTSRSEIQLGWANDAVAWLVAHQASDGHWPTYGLHDLKLAEPVLTTALALEAVTRSEHTNVSPVIERARTWLVGAQAVTGAWEEDSLPNPLLSVVVVEALSLVHETTMPASLTVAKNLLKRSELLAKDPSSDGRQLAVVAAHTGAEAFLYTILELPEIGRKVFDSDGKTIGLREALKSLRAEYTEQKLIGNGARLPYQGGVENLAYLRDQIAHKGLEVSARQIETPLSACLSFVSYVSKETLGRDVLSD